jgi:hypothetical protein
MVMFLFVVFFPKGGGLTGSAAARFGGTAN